MKLKLLPKFILSLGAMALVLTITISLFGYNTSKSYLEEMYAERVMTNCNAIAAMLDVEKVKTVLAEGGDETNEYEEMYALFNQLKRDGDVTFLSLTVPDEDSVHFYIDAMVEEMGDDPANQLPYGSDILYVDAANPDDPADMEKYITIWERFAEGRGLDVPLVTDNDYGYNYTGVSVIRDADGSALAEVQYVLDMKEVRSYLYSFLNRMLMISFVIIALTSAAYVILVRKAIIKPLGALARFTQEITDTRVFENQRIAIKTGDEIESLSDSFNFMLAELEDYIANLSQVTAEKERIGAELDVARHIQASMLPCIFPAFPERHEFDIYASMTPAKEVGGDFYDFFLVDDDHLAMVMADVSGKGVPAALFMMISKTLIKSAAQSGLSPKAVLEKVNDQLCENNDAEMFVTVWLGILEISSGKMRCANAGHEYPAILRRGGEFELFKDKHGFVLAGMEGMRYREYELELKAGDRLFVYTDGVPEATAASGELFGTERMVASLNRAKDEPCRALLERVHRDVDAFTGEAEQFDDITMLCLERKAAEPEMKKVSMTPSLECIGEATAFFEGILSTAGVEEKTLMQADVAVDEIFSNIARYSGATTVTLGCAVTDGEVVLRFSDNGRPYDPTGRPDPDITLGIDEREAGGLGILMVKKLMDEVRYEYADALNILTLVKKR